MFRVETQTIDPGQISVSFQVIKPTLVVAEYLEGRKLGVIIQTDLNKAEST